MKFCSFLCERVTFILPFIASFHVIIVEGYYTSTDLFENNLTVNKFRLKNNKTCFINDPQSVELALVSEEKQLIF